MIRLILDKIHEETKVNRGGKWQSVISDLFEGYQQSQVQCLQCDKKSLTNEKFYEVSLSIPNSNQLENLPNKPKMQQTKSSWTSVASWTNWVSSSEPQLTLRDCLDVHCAAEILDGENKYYCEYCKECTVSEKQLSFTTLPEVLCIHIKRFKYGNLSGGTKQDEKISFQKNLELPLNTTGQSADYELIGIINHQGSSVNSGHYVSYVKRDDSWYEFNDSYVSQVPETMVLDVEAYILFYCRKKSQKQTQFLSKILTFMENKRHTENDLTYKNYAMVSRYWWAKFLTMAEPGVDDDSAFICPHGKFHPKYIHHIGNFMQPIPPEVWNKMNGNYPSMKKIRTNEEACKICQDELKAIEKRRTEEQSILQQLDRKELNFGESFNAISTAWLNKFRSFLHGKVDSIQPPIDNTPICQAGTNQLRYDISTSEYTKIVPPVWQYLHTVYRGGPEVKLP